jgi:hypothetical protein
MPFNGTSHLVEALWAFVDQYQSGDDALRSGFDQFFSDLIAAINAQATYTQSLIVAAEDPRFLGRVATVPTTRADASALQSGDWFVSSAAPAGRVNVQYVFNGSSFVAMNDFAAVGATGIALVAAATQSAARGVLGLGTAATQNVEAFAAASVAADIALTLRLAADGLAKSMTSNDWNNAHLAGPGTAFVQGSAASLNAPAAVNASGIYVAYDANNGFALAFTHTTGAIYYRARVSSTWAASWTRLPLRTLIVANSSVNATLSEPVGIDLLRIGPSVTDLPAPAAEGDTLLNSVQDTNNAAQMLLTRGGSLLTRGRLSGVTSAWRRLQQSVVLATKSATNVASLDFTEFDNTVFDFYTMRVTRLRPMSDGVIAHLRTSTDGGATYDAGGTDYSFGGWEMGSSLALNNTGSSGLAQFRLSSPVLTMGNAATEMGLSGDITIHEADDNTSRTRIHFFGTYDDTVGGLVTYMVGGRRNLIQDTNAVRILFSSGNIADGEVELVGHRK